MAFPKISHSKPDIGAKEVKALVAVLKSGIIASGRETEELEKIFARKIKRKYAVALNSGTSALHLSLLALGAGAGSEVIIPSYVCTALLNAVNYTGATAVIADVSPDDGNIRADFVKKKITSKTKAVIVPHMFGKPAETKEIAALGIPVIEDCAQSLGSQHRGKIAGEEGKISVFSFYATKVIAAGEGGIAATDNKAIAAKIRNWRSYDGRGKYEVRYNYKMTDMSASLAKVQLSRLTEFIKKRGQIASLYKEKISSRNIIHPSGIKGGKHIYYRYVVKIKKGNVDKIVSKFHGKNICAEKPVFKPLHRYLKLRGADFPGSEECQRSFISLPLYPALSNREAERVARVSLEIFGG